MANNVYLPKPLYEGLPWIYLLLAVLVAVATFGWVKWFLTAALILSSLTVLRRRRNHRNDERYRRAAALMHKYSVKRRQEAEESGS